MKDILGREVNQGDLVVVKPTGKYSSGLAVGVMYKKSVRFKTGKVGSYSQVFKIVNPSKEEQEIRDKILSEIEEETKHMKRKTIPKNQLEVGRLYLAKNGTKQWYLGEGEYQNFYRSKDKEWIPCMRRVKCNNGYLCADYSLYRGSDLSYNTLMWTKARKTPPQFVEALDEKLDITEKELVLLSEKRGDSSYQDKIEIKFK